MPTHDVPRGRHAPAAPAAVREDDGGTEWDGGASYLSWMLRGGWGSSCSRSPWRPCWPARHRRRLRLRPRAISRSTPGMSTARSSRAGPCPCGSQVAVGPAHHRHPHRHAVHARASPAAVMTEVEVAGGSVKDPAGDPNRWTGAVGPSEMRVTLTADAAAVTGTAALGWNDAVESVGLLPGLASQAPEPVPLPMDLGRAVFAQLDAQVLATPGALGPLASIVTGPTARWLPPGPWTTCSAWVEDGGQLLVDAPPGSPVAGLPEEWQPAGARAAAGDGWVRLTDGAAARGRWARIIEPTRQFGPRSSPVSGSVARGRAGPVARDAGLRMPDIGWLVGFLVAYVVVVGPLTFVLLRRTRRTRLGLGGGAARRRGVHHGPSWRAAGSAVRRGRPTEGSCRRRRWATGWSAMWAWCPGTAAIPRRSSPRAGSPAGSTWARWPRCARTRALACRREGADHHGRRRRATGFGLPLGSGDFGIVTGRGRLEGESPLQVTATAAADGSVSGTITNSSTLDLEAVIVVVGGRGRRRRRPGTRGGRRPGRSAPTPRGSRTRPVDGGRAAVVRRHRRVRAGPIPTRSSTTRSTPTRSPGTSTPTRRAWWSRQAGPPTGRPRWTSARGWRAAGRPSSPATWSRPSRAPCRRRGAPGVRPRPRGDRAARRGGRRLGRPGGRRRRPVRPSRRRRPRDAAGAGRRASVVQAEVWGGQAWVPVALAEAWGGAGRRQGGDVVVAGGRVVVSGTAEAPAGVATVARTTSSGGRRRPWLRPPGLRARPRCGAVHPRRRGLRPGGGRPTRPGWR